MSGFESLLLGDDITRKPHVINDFSKATSQFVQANGESQNYGYTFWIKYDWENVPKDTFMSRGHNLNSCCVVPSLDLVVARQGNENGTSEERSRFVETFLEKIAAAITAKT